MRRVTSSMKLGFSLPVAGAWATPENQVRVAQEAERHVALHDWPVARTLEIMAALAPGRCLPSS